MTDRLLRDAFVIVAVAFVALRILGVQPWADSVDAYAYWTTRDGSFYDGASTGRIGSYLYSPAFAQLVAPLVWLPLAVFTALWTGFNVVALWFLLRKWALPSLVFVPIAFEVISGNVHLLYGAAIVLGTRWPAAWALMLLTKVTPGVGLVWFAVRCEWRSLAIALGATTLIVAFSLAVDPGHWKQWVEVLSADSAASAGGSVATTGWHLPVALGPRLALALAVAAVAGITDRIWLLPVAVVLALPVLWLNGLATLAACIPLARGDSRLHPRRQAARAPLAPDASVPT